MNKTAIAASLALAATIGACSLDNVGPEYEAIPNGPSLITTFEGAWVGIFKGAGRVELLEAGESYDNLPVCVETWIEAGGLHGVVHVQLFPPEGLLEIADGLSKGHQTGACAGTGVVMTARRRIEDITSPSTLLLHGPDGVSLTRDKGPQTLQLERHGDELVGLLTVFRNGFSPTASSPGGSSEIAQVYLQLGEVK